MGPTYTYTELPTRITMRGAVTTHHIISLLDALHLQFGAGYAFRAEPITEGGIEMIAWPGRLGEEGYKSLRFRFDNQQGDWPWIDADTEARWRATPAEVIWKPDYQRSYRRRQANQGSVGGKVLLKAFHGAPCWTREECERFFTAFRAAGFTVQKQRPAWNILVSHGDLGSPS